METSIDQTRAWQFKRELDSLDAASGEHTSLVSLLMPNKPSSLQKARELLISEIGTASSIKSASTRNAVRDALCSIQARLKQIN
jgi:peptide subunit release factor 1 (eRF1)